MERDPVCGMPVATEPPRFVVEWGGQYYWFCSEGCLREFERHLDDYVKSDASAQRGIHDV